MIAKYMTIIFAIAILILLVEMIREEKLTFKYAMGWIVFTIVGMICAIFDHVLFDAAHFFGFELTSNFIFFTLLTVFIFMGLLLTIFLCQQNSHNDTIAQKLGILEFELKQLKEKCEQDQQKKQ